MGTPSGRFVVGIDGSAASVDALRWAGRLAGALDGWVQAVTVPDRQSSYYGYSVGSEIVSPHDDAIRTLDTAVRKAFGDATPVRVERVIRGSGNPADVLVEAGQGAEMLIVGGRTHGGVAGALLGTVGSACVERAPCPVLVVHADDGSGGLSVTGWAG